MSKTSLWDATSMRRDDLPNLQDLFLTCDHKLLRQVIIDDFACRGAPVDKKQRKAMNYRLETSLDAMGSLPVAHNAAKNWILMPRETYGFSAQSNAISWRIHAAQAPLLSKEIAKAFMGAADSEASSYKRVKKASKRLQKYAETSESLELKQVASECWERNFTLAPWQETLGCKVWLGGTWCSRERYAVLASAYWEMTFYGFEYERVEARIMSDQAKKVNAVSLEKEARKEQTKIDRLYKEVNRFGLEVPDPFFDESRKCLARRIAILNHRAQCAYFNQIYDVVRRLERGEQYETGDTSAC